MPTPIPVFVHEVQAAFEPLHEWSFGERVDHPESAARVDSILRALDAEPGVFERREPAGFDDARARELHDAALLQLFDVVERRDLDVPVFPSSFPQGGRADPTNPLHAGAYCYDTGTPLSRAAVRAARWAAASAEEAAMAVLEGVPLSYALCRPPGHHASRDRFGGYCYYNNAALAALVLRERGRVAVLDVDYHHGNGTQSLFYADGGVFTASLHADPSRAFPYHFGYTDERGEGPGEGANLNVPLEEGVDGQGYLEALERQVLPALRAFGPDVLVLSMGLDTYHLDPLGTFALRTEDYVRVGDAIRGLGMPIVAVQEGGYHVADLGTNAAAMLRGLAGRG